jgi:membrane associated rhomboid family serine protease
VTGPQYCYRHPDRETGLSCSECGRPICYECMTPAPVGLRCPEHSGKPQGIQKVTRAVSNVGGRRVNAVTLGLIGINVAVYLAELAAGGQVNGTGNWIYEHGALFASLPLTPFGVPVGVAHGDWWRLITAAFLHYGPLHLGMNMYGLYIAGSLLEQVIGRWRFLCLYLAAGIAGSAGALWLTQNSPTAGASGAIFGVFGALFVLERRRHISTGGQIAALIVLNLVFTFAVPGISVGGHVGGLIGGAALMVVLLQFRRSAAISLASTFAVIAIAVVIAYVKTRNYA